MIAKLETDFWMAFNPSSHEKYSPNLYKWLRRESKYFQPKVYRHSDYGHLYIGRDDESFFIGTKLMNVLCDGIKAKTGAFIPPMMQRLCLIPDFWNLYREVGRCAIDPDHQTLFLNAENRFEETDDHRTCLWCGFKQERQRYTVTFERERWIESKNPEDAP